MKNILLVTLFSITNFYKTQTIIVNSVLADPCPFALSVYDVKKEKIEIFPNPASNFLNIKFNEILDKNDIQIKIMDLTGKIVLKENIKTKSSKEIVNISLDSLINGIYFISIYYDERLVNKKIILNKK